MNYSGCHKDAKKRPVRHRELKRGGRGSTYCKKWYRNDNSFILVAE